jgi:glucokinase
MSDWILAGLITPSELMLSCYRLQDGPFVALKEKSYPVRKIESLEAVLEEFLNRNTDPVRAACFCSPWMLEDGILDVPDSKLSIDRELLSIFLGGAPLYFIDTFHALSESLQYLPASCFHKLNDVEPDPEGNQALIHAGKILGEVVFIRNQDDWISNLSFGGHTEYAPTTQIEVDLLQYLMKEYKHVSYERVITEPGLYNVYKFFRDSGRAPAPEPDWLTRRLSEEDPAAVIAEVGMAGQNDLCTIVLGRWVKILAQEAGNLALSSMATSGVYVSGWILPQIMEWLVHGLFIQAFSNKGRFKDFMKQIPVYVLQDLNAPLMGAARYVFEQEAPEALDRIKTSPAPRRKSHGQRPTLQGSREGEQKIPVVQPRADDPAEKVPDEKVSEDVPGTESTQKPEDTTDKPGSTGDTDQGPENTPVHTGQPGPQE